MQNKFSLYLKLFQFQKYLYLLVHDFPKEYKYTLGQSILDKAWETIDNAISANLSENKYKYGKITEVVESFDKLKTRVRMAWELKIISDKKYSFMIKEITFIGKEISGWLIWSKSTKPK